MSENLIDNVVQCPYCDGYGKIKVSDFKRNRKIIVTCYPCGGFGQLPINLKHKAVKKSQPKNRPINVGYYNY